MRNATRWFVALLAVTTLGTAGNLCVYNDLVRLTVDLPRTGCAAVDPGEQVTVEVGPSEMQTYKTQVTLSIQPGYYHILYASAHCWEYVQSVVLLPHLDREIAVKFPTWVRKPGVDYDIYYVPVGALAGLGGTDIRGISIEDSPKRRGGAYEPIRRQGAYYFDEIRVGKYRLRYSLANGAADERTVLVRKDIATIVDL